MAGTSVFGRPASQGIADRVLSSPSLNANPSPSQPEHAPPDQLAKRYASLAGIASESLPLEEDHERRSWLESVVAYCDRVLDSMAGAMSSAGAPVPNVQTAPPPPAPAPMVPPQAAPAGSAPGGPPAPPPGAPA